MRFNPFNYTKPVRGQDFKGRPEDGAQVDYHVKEAVSGNLMNLAIVGSPRIGKTSLLNYVRFRAS